MPKERKPIRPQTVLALAAMFASGGLAACASSHPRYVNCVDQRTGQVVDPRYCDDPHYYGSPGSSYVIWTGGSRVYGPGYVVPIQQRSGFINPGDSAARAKANLPATGKVGGTKISGGGIGKGGGKVGG